MSCAMTPAQPQCEHQMPSTGLAEDLLTEFTRGTYLRLLKHEDSWLTSMCSGHSPSRQLPGRISLRYIDAPLMVVCCYYCSIP